MDGVIVRIFTPLFQRKHLAGAMVESELGADLGGAVVLGLLTYRHPGPSTACQGRRSG